MFKKQKEISECDRPIKELGENPDNEAQIVAQATLTSTDNKGLSAYFPGRFRLRLPTVSRFAGPSSL
jgi:hypothetical protein